MPKSPPRVPSSVGAGVAVPSGYLRTRSRSAGRGAEKEVE